MKLLIKIILYAIFFISYPYCLGSTKGNVPYDFSGIGFLGDMDPPEEKTGPPIHQESPISIDLEEPLDNTMVQQTVCIPSPIEEKLPKYENTIDLSFIPQEEDLKDFLSPAQYQVYAGCGGFNEQPALCRKDSFQPSAAQLIGTVLLNFQALMQIGEGMTRVHQDTCNSCFFSKAFEGHLKLSTQVMGSNYAQGKRQNLLGFDAQIYGACLGAETVFSPQFVGGVNVGYSYSKLHWDQSKGKAFVLSTYLSSQAAYLGKQGYAQVYWIGARTFYRTKRENAFPCLQGAAYSKHKGWDLAVGVKGGINFKVLIGPTSCILVPEGELSYLNSFEGGYRERGMQNGSLSILRKYSSLLYQRVSVRILKEFCIRECCLVPSFCAGYLYDLFLTSNPYSLRFYKNRACPQRFTVNGFHQSTHQLLLDALVALSFRPHYLLVVGYETRWGERSKMHEGKLRFEWVF